LISEQGDVMTAAHLVQTAELVRVTFADGSFVNATIVATEPAADVALLKLDSVPQSAVVARMGDSDTIRIGEPIFIIGAPFGLSHTLTVGYISARHAPGTLNGELVLGEFLQTDAAINRGNSGGPMFNMAGEVVGIVSYILSKSGGFEGVGFAVTSNTARAMLLEKNSLWTGVTVFGLSGMMADLFNLPQDTGYLVQRVARGSLGARFGLRPSIIPARIGKFELFVGGDIILTIDHIQVGTPESEDQLRRYLTVLEPGQTVDVTVLRQGKLVTLSGPALE
jgi:S1-C subfamily serine protease